MLTRHGLAAVSRQAFSNIYIEIEQKSNDAGNASAHQSLFDHGEGLLDFLYDRVRNGHGVGAAAVEGVGLQAVTILGVPHLSDHANRVALDELAHEGGVVEVDAVAVVLRAPNGVGVVFHHRHILLRFAPHQSDR